MPSSKSVSDTLLNAWVAIDDATCDRSDALAGTRRCAHKIKHT